MAPARRLRIAKVLKIFKPGGHRVRGYPPGSNGDPPDTWSRRTQMRVRVTLRVTNPDMTGSLSVISSPLPQSTRCVDCVSVAPGGDRPDTPSGSTTQPAHGDVLPLRRFGEIFPIRQNGTLFDAVVIRSWYDGDLLVVKCGMRHDGSIKHMTCSKFVGYEPPPSARPTRYC